MTELHGKNGEPSIRERTGQLKVGFMERLLLKDVLDDDVDVAVSYRMQVGHGLRCD